LAQALDGGSGDLLHRARKPKRARYAAELRKPLDKRAKRTVKHFKHIQTVLGDHQDAVVATDALRRMAVTAGTTPGENGFTYGLLYAREQQIAAQSRKPSAGSKPERCCEVSRGILRSSVITHG
jgi:CHAD domain-containing protein